jgi:hypothetical protein
MPATFQYQIFADYHQFYLQDDDMSFGDLSNAWTDEATNRLLAVASHVIGVGTVRNMKVPVSVVIHESSPKINPGEWDHITTASLQIDSGRIVVAGCTDYYPDAARIEVKPGVYEAIICYANLASLSPDGLKGEDSYHIHLFPGREIPPAILKKRKPPISPS